MFCDQDDVWHPDKIEKSMKQMRRLEKNMAQINRCWFIRTFQSWTKNSDLYRLLLEHI